MNKFLRYSLAVLLMAVCHIASATDVLFDFDAEHASMFAGITGVSASGDTSGDITSEVSYVKSGVTMAVTPATGTTPNRFWTDYNTQKVQLRLYKGATLSFSVPSGKKITKIAYVHTTKKDNKDGISADSGTLDIDNAEWTGDAQSVTFSFTKGYNFATITVTVEEGAAEATLTISGQTPFVTSTEVTIKSSASNAMIYYTLDGSDPADESNDNAISYTAPFTITESCTVKAFDETTGKSAEMTFEKTELPKAANIAAFKALEKGSEAELTLTDAEVLYVGTNDTYVRDASGAIDFFKAGLNLEAGNKVNGTVTGKYDIYQNAPEFVKTDATNADNLTSTAATVSPKELTLSVMKDSKYVCDLVLLRGVTVGTFALDKNNVKTSATGTIGDESIALYNKFKLALSDTDPTKAYDVTGILLPYNDDYEIALTGDFVESEVGPVGPTIVDVNNIAEFVALEKGKHANLTLNNAQVTHIFNVASNGYTQAFVRDESGSVEFYYNGDNNLNFEVGESINGSVIVTRDEYNGLPEAVALTGYTNDDNLLHGEVTEVTPTEITIAEAANNLSNLVIINGATITTDGTTPVDPQEGSIKFDINTDYATLFPTLPGTSSGSGATAVTDGDITETITSSAVDGATITVTANPSGTPNRIWSAAPRLRMYGGTLTITAPTGQTMNGIVFTLHNQPSNVKWADGNTVNTGTLTAPAKNDQGKFTETEAKWTGSANEVVLSVAANTQIGVIELQLAGAAPAPYEETTEYYLTVGTEKIKLYNEFADEAFNDFEQYVGTDKYYNATGIVKTFKGTLQLIPTKFDATTGINTTSVTKADANTPMYNIAGQRVNNSYKGVVIQNGKKFMNK